MPGSSSSSSSSSSGSQQPLWPCPAAAPMPRMLAALLLLALLLQCCAAARPPAPPQPFGDPVVLQRIASRPSKCGPACQEHGTCNEELGRCDCPRDRDGPHCEVVLDAASMEARCSTLAFNGVAECRQGIPSCVNACNARGTCHLGVCQCLHGHYGTDCSLSLDDEGRPQVLQGTRYATRARRPWIYIYDLPPLFNMWTRCSRIDRPTFFHFWQRILGSGALTADAKQADYFLLPLNLRDTTDLAKKLPGAIDYVYRVWPWAAQVLKGRNLVMHTGDWGRMEGTRWMGNPIARDNFTWLTHWGLFRDKNGWLKAHDPGKDVVVPVITYMGRLGQFGHDYSSLHPKAKGVPPRNTVLFFAGRICGEKRPPNTSMLWPHNCKDAWRYSGGVRARVHSNHHNRPGFAVSLHTYSSYNNMLKTSKFCLSTQGGGHGNRQVVGSAAGCAPVSIGDFIYEPFEPELDYNDFGVRVAEDDIPRLHEILGAVGEEGYARKQTGLKCGAQHLSWSSMTGSFMGESGRYDAFETTMEALRAHVLYPNVPPQRYSKMDADFRRFMACGAEKGGNVPPPEPKRNMLCSGSMWDRNLSNVPQYGREPRGWAERLARTEHSASPHKCGGCPRFNAPALGVPGGALCCGHPDLSTCPRPWD